MRCRQLILGLTVLALVMSPGLASAGPGAAPGQAPPTNTAAPTISGLAQLGNSLTANIGAGEGKGLKVAYQWQGCDSSGGACGALAGATAASYTPVAADAARTLRVMVVASNNNGSAVATSDPTAVVTSPPPPTPSSTTTATTTTPTTSTTTPTWSTTTQTTSATTPTTRRPRRQRATPTTTTQQAGSPYWRGRLQQRGLLPQLGCRLRVGDRRNPFGFYEPCQRHDP